MCEECTLIERRRLRRRYRGGVAVKGDRQCSGCGVDLVLSDGSSV